MDSIERADITVDEVSVWRDASCICIKTTTSHGDPVELSDDEAIELAETSLRLAGQRR